MAAYDDYRAPDEIRAQDQQHARIQAVIAQAVRDGGSLLAAMTLDEPQDVIELWTDRVWNGLRDGLIDGPGYAGEDRLAAIALLLEDRFAAEATSIIAQVREAAGPSIDKDNA